MNGFPPPGQLIMRKQYNLSAFEYEKFVYTLVSTEKELLS